MDEIQGRNRMEPTLKEFVEIPSASGNSIELDNAVRKIKMFLGKNFIYEEFTNKNIKSVLISKNRTRKFKVLLYGHIDVVPAKEYKVTEKEDRLFGRGVYDMKGIVWNLIELFKELNKEDIGFLICTDEETGGSSTKLAVENNVSADLVLMPDGGSENVIITNQKGSIFSNLELVGKSCHAAYPEKGNNPILKLSELLTEIRKMEKVYPGLTIVPTILSSGNTINQIPEKLTIKFNIRFTELKSRKDALEMLNKYGKFEITHEDPIYNVDKNNPLVKKYIDLAKKELGEIKFETSAGVTDAVYFKNTPVILHRPNGGGQHSEKEWLDIKSMERFKNLTKKFIEDI